MADLITVPIGYSTPTAVYIGDLYLDRFRLISLNRIFTTIKTFDEVPFEISVNYRQQYRKRFKSLINL